MSIEHAVRKVSMEIGVESIDMAEELTLLAAEMSYLPDRRTAFENFNARTGLESIRSLTTVLIQSERYGTPLGACAARAQPGKSRSTHERRGKEGGGAAADADGADDPVLSAWPVRGHPHAGGHSDQPLELTGRAPGKADFRCARATRRRMIRHAPRDFPIVVRSV